jgi:hypothetical protein
MADGAHRVAACLTEEWRDRPACLATPRGR